MMSWRGLGSKSIVIAGMALVIALPVHAGSSWLSSVVTISDDNTNTRMASSLSSSALQRMGGSSAESRFNLTISIEENPSGDDVYPDDSGAGDDEQNKFEQKIEEFADAVFQMTNGKHKIGTVTIFRGGVQSNNADVQWIENCPSNEGPRAHPSGFGVAGKRIYFCTNWPGSSTMDTPKGAGFTLAHEWGHYAYGVYDEYSSSCGQSPETGCAIWLPRSTDTVSSPSIMNNQWNAAGASGDPDWLEFSTDGVEPYSTQADGDDKNAHARVFDENAWRTLTRDPATDPRFSFLPPRTRYTNLVAPTTDLTVNDDESTARSELKIIWAGDQVVELMIDTSGSMQGAPIGSAKSAASLLVGQLTEGENAVGVGRFSSSSFQVFPITDIPDPDTGIRADAQLAIDGFSASGGTNIEAAALTALNEVQSFQGGTRPSVVFLLTDGQSRVDVDNVVMQYTDARVPLITFGFGAGVDSTLLQDLANGTGGQYFFSPTSLAQIQQAFVAANAAFSSTSVIASSTTTVPAGSTDVNVIPLDSTLDTVSLSVSYALSESDIALRVLDATGSDTGLQFSCDSSFEVSCEVQVDMSSLTSGDYGVEVVNNSAADKNVSILVAGTPSAFENFDIAVEAEDVVYPGALSIRASVSKGSTLSGLDVVANITKPDGSSFEIQLLDDGINSDLVAEDGIYSADVPYDQDGSYTVVVMASNAAGSAETTFEGMAISVREDGTGVIPQRRSITENFMRVAVASVGVSNFQADDHSDDASDPTACTTIVDDNIDALGNIDSAGDIDCFSFVPSDTSADLVARVTSLREDMQPLVRVYDSTGSNQLIEVELASSPNPASGVIAAIPSGSLDAAGHIVTVEHEDAAASAGGYALSVGAVLGSDGVDPGNIEPPVVNPPVTGEGPTVPGGFRYVVYSETAAELFWSRSTDDGQVVGYDITRNGVLVETRDATSFFDDSLSPGELYVYEINAVDNDGNRSQSDSVRFMTRGTSVPNSPSVPGGFRFAVYSDTAAELFWDRSSDDGRVVGYDITRNGVLVETRDATSYFDDSLSPGIVYSYIINAVDDEGNRSGSSTVSLTTGSNPAPIGNPSVPAGFRSAVYSSTAAELFWERSVDDGQIAGYEIRRDGVLVETRDATSYFDDSLSPGTTYTYDIVAVDNDGNRSPSNMLSLTTR